MAGSHYVCRAPRSLKRRVGVHQVSPAIDPLRVDAFVAAIHAQPQMAEQMLGCDEELSACRSSWGETGIQAAAHLGQRALVWRFVEAGLELDLFSACAVADQTTVMRRYVPELSGMCGVHGLPLLHFAIVSGVKLIVEKLLA